MSMAILTVIAEHEALQRLAAACYRQPGEHLERPGEVDLVEPVEGEQPDLKMDFVRNH
jgi:hypothetical protein